jgi:hydroxyacylglutathione hydrolase
MFEGTPVQMNASLNRLKNLPGDTAVYCGHEYTADNLKFALTVEPQNRAALEYQARVRSLREADAATLPSRVALERQVNPFLRCDEASVRAAASVRAGRPVEEAAEVFGVLRAWKDQFR